MCLLPHRSQGKLHCSCTMIRWCEMSLALLALSCSYFVVSSERGPTGSSAGITEVQEKLHDLASPSLKPILLRNLQRRITNCSTSVILGSQHWLGCSALSPTCATVYMQCCLTEEVRAIFFFPCLHFRICICNPFSAEDKLL